MKPYYNIVQQDKRADIYIFGDITVYPYKSGDYSAGSLVREIQALDADEIHVHIDCFGGSVKEGWGMYNALKNHRAKVVTYADGFVASAALYPFLAGEQRIASAVSAFYLHEVSMSAHGYASELREAADDAEKLTDIGIQAFVERTGMKEAKVKQLMAEETWLTPGEALEMGIATAMTRTEASQSFTQSVRANLLQAVRAAKAKPENPPAENVLKIFFT